ncbi:conserved Plasmodium protein, unknown function [Plasmodium knowlesi strain H]|uniref:Uncharacterized protein n=3 Tax=Plasmodium knowlesi TaxID=5850 RepID=A0A5K1VKZ4_PLAKH|nr:conserved Plasmodium protein, unknown function [Plasmodium knowlesi strain H]OTN63889.1 Uncharacterized protein PKNOH_S140256400 [Plasmodium knowlesi]CAA9990979.1 conserved Plasmodium protein, unknown function [Plasmodium knowlesi strain H]SBO20770.1 conserved Plasmodium protein, unknown function [Plasmodium knowlesi strain H]SBO21220.1 conserved Plasmodium protein, unknown function [Plasmodium knowlesi strain H]VVS80453.1 conserved Plasmodium protein, unknown function [Plasmodium knowlesi |eukprot:XP_002262262.1 hypothetical protein, conserved in Plasmodium species [Plasmodium knowlesi strain H]
MNINKKKNTYATIRKKLQERSQEGRRNDSKIHNQVHKLINKEIIIDYDTNEKVNAKIILNKYLNIITHLTKENINLKKIIEKIKLQNDKNESILTKYEHELKTKNDIIAKITNKHGIHILGENLNGCNIPDEEEQGRHPIIQEDMSMLKEDDSNLPNRGRTNCFPHDGEHIQTINSPTSCNVIGAGANTQWEDKLGRTTTGIPPSCRKMNLQSDHEEGVNRNRKMTVSNMCQEKTIPHEDENRIPVREKGGLTNWINYRHKFTWHEKTIKNEIPLFNAKNSNLYLHGQSKLQENDKCLDELNCLINNSPSAADLSDVKIVPHGGRRLEEIERYHKKCEEEYKNIHTPNNFVDKTNSLITVRTERNISQCATQGKKVIENTSSFLYDDLSKMRNFPRLRNDDNEGESSEDKYNKRDELFWSGKEKQATYTDRPVDVHAGRMSVDSPDNNTSIVNKMATVVMQKDSGGEANYHTTQTHIDAEVAEGGRENYEAENSSPSDKKNVQDDLEDDNYEDLENIMFTILKLRQKGVSK